MQCIMHVHVTLDPRSARPTPIASFMACTSSALTSVKACARHESHTARQLRPHQFCQRWPCTWSCCTITTTHVTPKKKKKTAKADFGRESGSLSAPLVRHRHVSGQAAWQGRCN